MSNAGHFNNKHAQEDKKPRARFFEDFPASMRQMTNGDLVPVKGGKIMPGALVKESKHVAKADIPKVESKYFKETLISTILEKSHEGETMTNKDTAGEKETTSRVRKPLDVNNRALKL